MTFTDIAANDDVEALSDNAADTMNLTITARKADGTLVSETKALTGTTAVIFSVIGVVERVERALLASDAACSTMTATSEARDHHPRRGERHPVRGKARHGVTVRYMFIRGRPVPTAQPS